MPFILPVPSSDTYTVKVALPKEGLEVDSRVILWDKHNNPPYDPQYDSTRLQYERKRLAFQCVVEGDILTVTRIDYNGGWRKTLYFRLYDPEFEKVPAFNTKFYTYFGLDYEMVPFDAEEVAVDESVKVIKSRAFDECKRMKKCTMANSVERIESHAFSQCYSLEDIELSSGLKFIGAYAFCHGHAIEL